MLNYVMMMGRLTADPELRTTQNGNDLATFSIAVQRPKPKDGEAAKSSENGNALCKTKNRLGEEYISLSSEIVCLTGENK